MAERKDVELDACDVMDSLSDSAGFLAEDVRQDMVDSLVQMTNDFRKEEADGSGDDGDEDSDKEMSAQQLLDTFTSAVVSPSDVGGFTDEERETFNKRIVCLDDAFWVALSLESLKYLSGYDKDFPVATLQERLTAHLTGKIKSAQELLPPSLERATEDEVAKFCFVKELSPMDHALLTIWSQQRGFYSASPIEEEMDMGASDFMDRTMDLAMDGLKEWMGNGELRRLLEDWATSDSSEQLDTGS